MSHVTGRQRVGELLQEQPPQRAGIARVAGEQRALDGLRQVHEREHRPVQVGHVRREARPLGGGQIVGRVAHGTATLARCAEGTRARGARRDPVRRAARASADPRRSERAALAGYTAGCTFPCTVEPSVQDWRRQPPVRLDDRTSTPIATPRATAVLSRPSRRRRRTHAARSTVPLRTVRAIEPSSQQRRAADRSRVGHGSAAARRSRARRRRAVRRVAQVEPRDGVHHLARGAALARRCGTRSRAAAVLERQLDHHVARRRAREPCAGAGGSHAVAPESSRVRM